MNAPTNVIRVKRHYQHWVANETLEDYSLRYAARSYRKWPAYLLVSTALGGISFLALEAIGASVMVSYGFANAFPAILVVCTLIFLTNLPITYYSSKYNVDMDLLTRGAGFGYIGSTITSLIYASFTFIFFALEAAIMAQALHLYFGIFLPLSYIFCALVILPLTFFGVTLINKLQLWTQPLWLGLMISPFVFILLQEENLFTGWSTFVGQGEGQFNILLFGSASGVLFSLVVQVGEQVDYLRFLPDKTPENHFRWWAAVISAGPGWIIIGGLKVLAGGLLVYLVLRGGGVDVSRAVEPIYLYIEAFKYMADETYIVLALATLFVIVSQIKINVTNAYAGSLAWSNFFSRLTHYHPGRVVWLVFNVMISLLLMLLGIFETLNLVLSVYSNVAIAWVGAICADLVVLKPLGISPPHIEFKRAYLYNFNPVGCGAMVISSLLSITAFMGAFGELAQALSSYLALTSSFISAVLIGYLTKGRYYLARPDKEQGPKQSAGDNLVCCICECTYEAPDMAHCPFYKGHICSLCCCLDHHCHDICKTKEPTSLEPAAIRPSDLNVRLGSNLIRRTSKFLAILFAFAVITAALFAMTFRMIPDQASADFMVKLYSAVLILEAVAAWWVVLSHESRELAEAELVSSLHFLEITKQELVQSEKMASLGGLVAGVAHEINTPIGVTVGAASHLQEKVVEVRRLFDLDQLRKNDFNRFLTQAEDSARLLMTNTTRAAALIQSFKQVAVDQTSSERRRFDLPEYIQETLMSLNPKLKDYKVETVINGPQQLEMDSFPGPIGQVITNFLINSLFHGFEKGETGKINISVLQLENDMIEIRYSDTGKGIPPEIRSRIFEPFVTTKRGRGGSGLGLHLVHNIVTQQLNGTIKLDGESSDEAFVVRIPRIHTVKLGAGFHGR